MKDIKIIQSKQAKAYKHQIKRVAAYARVSTKQEMQESSLDIQVRYYAKEIIFHPDYIFAGIYYDHGKSGTSMKKRDGLQALLKKVYAGHIDLVLVKSLSRFARNTIDALKVIQETRKLGVEFFFEKENLSSLDYTIDMILTMMAGLAEAESQQISSNIRWGHRSRAKNGKLHIHPCFGYDITKDRKYIINEDEAETVRAIFQMKLAGEKPGTILRYVQSKNHRTTRGYPFTKPSQIQTILKNEKYAGKIIYGKTYIKVDGLEKKSCINNGEQPKYIINNHHEPIIDIETFDAVQAIYDKQKRKQKKRKRLDLEHYEQFGYSIPHKKKIYRLQTNLDVNDEETNKQDYLISSQLPRFYHKHLSKVLYRSLNALSRKFGRMELIFDHHTNNLLSKDDILTELTDQEHIVEDYMRQYYALGRKTPKSKKDRMLLYELETLIIQESINYTALEDEYNNLEEHQQHVLDIKKRIKALTYPTQSLNPDIINSIFDGLLIADYDTIILFINVTGKKLNHHTMKNTEAKPLLHTGAYKTKGRIDTTIKWSIRLC